MHPKAEDAVDKKVSVLYIVYWGALEPLGQSLVLPAIKRLADIGVDLTLVTFEKPNDLLRRQELNDLRETLESRSIKWLSLRYHKHPKTPATLFDCVQGCVRSILASLQERPDIVHARTFVGGLMGLAISGILRSKLIYHNEGFYPDEQVDAGVWKAGSRQHKIAKSLESLLYERADAVIALSHKGKSVIESLPHIKKRLKPIIVVPSCVDLDHFKQFQRQKFDPPEPLRIVYAGSVGGRYSLERIARFAFIASRDREVHLRVLTRSDKDLVAPILESSGLARSAWTVESVHYQRMPDELANGHVGVHFLPQGLSDQGGSPTKIGEYWASGLPVVVTRGAGDCEDIIRREKVGVLVGGHSDEEYCQALEELSVLMKDSELAVRCRRAAETNYSLPVACDRQFQVYGRLATRQQVTAVSSAPELGKH